MILDDKMFEQITAENVLSLIPDIAEGRRLDYKQALPDEGDKGVRSFLNDVCALANSAGGYLVYGVDEERDDEGKKTGVPSSVCGVGEVNEDKAILDWQQRINQCIEPRIIGHRVGFVNGFDNGVKVMLVYVPKSLFAPHRVTFKGARDFYVRHDRGNQLMDIGEIRHSFVEAKEVPQRIDEFRRQRVMQILAGETPIELLDEWAVYVCHLVPLSSFAEDAGIDVTALGRHTTTNVMKHSVGGGRLNADGYLFTTGLRGDYERGYVQVNRTGTVEMVGTISDIPSRTQRGSLGLPSQWQEEGYLAFVASGLEILRDLGVRPPVYIGISLLRVKGVVMIRPQRFIEEGEPIDKDNLIVPTVFSETLEESVDQLMRPAFDMVWQASGLPSSPYYDDEGNWAGR